MTSQPTPPRDSRRVEFGDWQTPDALAEQVLELLARDGFEPGTVLEPTCGVGAFLVAAATRFPAAKLLGFDVSAEYVDAARERLALDRTLIQTADFFTLDWPGLMAELAGPLLIVGNPPWVTNSALGALSGANLPPKANFKAQPGLEALTGKSNFDVSEWMLIRLLEAAQGQPFRLAMLCKGSVARRVMQHAAREGWELTGAVYGVDARLHFGAAVDAVLLDLSPADDHADAAEPRWAAYPSLSAARPSHAMGLVGGRLCSDVSAYQETQHLAGGSALEWRSGLKHDCAALMELRGSDGAWSNQLGEIVDVEPEFVYPLLKGSDVANGRMQPRRAVIVTQRQLGEDTSSLETRAPKLWRYLCSHGARLDQRKSRIYARQARFAMFGVGEYSFTPYKVAICGLYKKLAFQVVEPFAGQPVMLDDTSYFLPCESRPQALALASALSSPEAQAFFEARVFWDAKRPVSKALLQSVSLEALLKAHGNPVPYPAAATSDA